MEPRRFQLEGPSLEVLKARVLAQHGPRARIIAAEKVTVGGIGGFLARHHYEVTVELPPRGRRRALEEPEAGHAAGKGGIGALLERAEEVEERLHASAALSSVVSTGSPAFAELMDTLTFSTETADIPAAEPVLLPQRIEAAAQVEPVPVPLSGAGDLVIVVGLGNDPLDVCRSMSNAAGAGSAGVRVAGLLAPDDVIRVGDRRAVAAARAEGVMGGHSIFLAYGLGRGAAELTRHATLVAALSADQLWVAVDAGRKAEDTAAWVGAFRTAAVVQALAVEGLEATASPQTVNTLGLPIGWLEGSPAPSSVLA